MKTELIQTLIYKRFYQPVIDHLLKNDPDNLDIIYKYFIAGGCFKNLYNDETPKDWDIFCTDENTSLEVLEIFENIGWTVVPEWKSSKRTVQTLKDFNLNLEAQIKEVVKSPEIVPRFTDLVHKEIPGKLQIIHKFPFPTVEDCFNSFDFTICMAGAYLKQIERDEPLEDGTTFHHNECLISTGQYFFEDLLTKRLRVNKITYPVDSLRRAFRYSDYGYKPCKGVVKELADAIHKMPNEVYNDTTLSQFYMVD